MNMWSDLQLSFTFQESFEGFWVLHVGCKNQMKKAIVPITMHNVHACVCLCVYKFDKAAEMT